METKEAVLFILDIYQAYDKFLSKEEGKSLFPVFHEDFKGKRKKWWFLSEHIKDI